LADTCCSKLAIALVAAALLAAVAGVSDGIPTGFGAVATNMEEEVGAVAV